MAIMEEFYKDPMKRCSKKFFTLHLVLHKWWLIILSKMKIKTLDVYLHSAGDF